MPWSQAGNVEPQPRTLKGDIPKSVAERLSALARALGVSIKLIALAAHIRVMNLISGQLDVVTGFVANGRIETEDGERVLGLFLNTLPFRIQLRGRKLGRPGARNSCSRIESTALSQISAR